MPFSATRDAETYWRSRYGLPPGEDSRPASGAHPRRRNPLLFRSVGGIFSPWRPRRRVWLAAFALAAGGAAVAYLAFRDIDEPVAAGAAETATGSYAGGAGIAGQAAEPDFAALLGEFAAAREASLIALDGYLLTDGEGFRAEWLEATVRLQSATDAIGRQSATWTDGRKLVQLVEMQRIVGRLLAEQSAVAAIVGTPNRYPGLQLFNEDVRPALDEAQAICAEVLTAMLADSSPEDAVAIDPVARLRGDLDDLRAALTKYIAASGETAQPATASAANFATLLETIGNVRRTAPAAVQPKIDRLAFLVGTAEKKLERIFALRASQRWDYADYAFRTRTVPLAEKLRDITAEWEKAA